MPTSKDASARVARRFEAIYSLLTSRPHTAAELAASLEISVPTFHTRYLPSIREWPGFETVDASEPGKTGPKAKAFRIAATQSHLTATGTS